MDADGWGAVSTWTKDDDLARRVDAVEALVTRWKDAEERKTQEQGVRIAIAVASSMWTLVLVGVLRIVL